VAVSGINKGACLFDVANGRLNGTLKNICLDLCVCVVCCVCVCVCTDMSRALQHLYHYFRYALIRSQNISGFSPHCFPLALCVGPQVPKFSVLLLCLLSYNYGFIFWSQALYLSRFLYLMVHTLLLLMLIHSVPFKQIHMHVMFFPIQQYSVISVLLVLF